MPLQPQLPCLLGDFDTASLRFDNALNVDVT